MRVGRVALVGAGPGDPGLLTIRGRKLVRRADVVVYDRLVHPRVVELASPHALRIFAGKARGWTRSRSSWVSTACRRSRGR